MKSWKSRQSRRFGRLAGVWIVFLWAIGEALSAQTPMTTILKENGNTLIECDVRDPKETMAVFATVDGGAENPVNSKKKDGYHYQLYIPKDYYTNANYHYPCLFISSPGGNANMSAAMAERLKKDQWIVVMLQESKNGSPDWFRNFLAAHDDVVERVRIAKGAKVATGCSGGARCSSVYAIIRPGMAGIVCQAAGFAYGFVPECDRYSCYPPNILVAGSFGDTDYNLFESHAILRGLKHSRAQVMYFKGTHTWCPGQTFDALMDWMEERLFADSAKSSGSPAATATTSKKSTGVKSAVKAESIDAEAYEWYLRKCKILLTEAQGSPARSLALERLLAVVEKGKLAQNKAIAAEAQEWKKEFSKLKASPEIQTFEKTARKAFIDAQTAEAAYLTAMKRGKAEYKKMNITSAERQALQKAIAAYQAVAKNYPEAPFAASAQESADSLEIALSKSN